MNLDKKTQEKVDAFARLLGPRFPKIEVASPGAPITVVATDPEDKQYYVRVELMESSVDSVRETGLALENKDYYQLAQLMVSSANVFVLAVFPDGFVLWYLNDIDKEQMKITDEITLIGIASALHIESAKDTKYAPPVIESQDGKSVYVLRKN
jgi:hypothetical protein